MSTLLTLRQRADVLDHLRRARYCRLVMSVGFRRVLARAEISLDSIGDPLTVSDALHNLRTDHLPALTRAFAELQS